jgi:hypothetical protein
MNKFIESAFIALAAIWSSKLRSLMTVLGNIVAVTSIIAVVSLIQGLNASVKSANSQSGRRRLVQHPAVSDHPQRRGAGQGPQQSPADAAGRPRHPALQFAGRRRHGRLLGQRAHHLSR